MTRVMLERLDIDREYEMANKLFQELFDFNSTLMHMRGPHESDIVTFNRELLALGIRSFKLKCISQGVDHRGYEPNYVKTEHAC
jgi:hypothetical protein